MKWISFSFLFVTFFAISTGLSAQQAFLNKDYTLLEYRVYNTTEPYTATIVQEDTSGNPNEFPTPKSVLFKSLMIPGWGQVVNNQIWKVPIIYGMFAGIGVYTAIVNRQYKDYRAAFYNATQGDDTDFRFGPTPERLQGINRDQLQANRNSFRNRRDFMFVVIGLAYGLNALDAYIFAHMRSFDVSDDLSARTTIQPTLVADGKPGMSVKFSIIKK